MCGCILGRRSLNALLELKTTKNFKDKIFRNADHIL